MLALVAYQGKTLISRVERLERNTTQIMVALGIPPVAVNTLNFGVITGDLGVSREIKEIKQSNRLDHGVIFFEKNP